MSLRQVLGLVDANKARSAPMTDNAEQHPLWTLLNSSSLPGSGSGSGMPPLKNLAALTLPALRSKDSTATSLRVLLCDAQDALQTFTQQVHTLVNDVGRAASQMDESVKVSEDQRAAATEDLKTLIIRVQNTITRSLEQTNATLGDLKTDFVRQDSKVESLQQQIVTLTQQLGLSLQHQTDSTRLLERTIQEQEKRTRLSLELYQRQEMTMLAQNNTNRQLLNALASMSRVAPSSTPAAPRSMQAQDHVQISEPAEPVRVSEVAEVEPPRARREIQTPPPTSPLALPVALVKTESHSAPSGPNDAPTRPPALSRTAVIPHTAARKARKISINTTVASSSPLSSPPVSRRGSISRGQKRPYDDMLSDSLIVGPNQNHAQFDQSVSAEMVVHGMGWLAPGSSGSNPNPAQHGSGTAVGPMNPSSGGGGGGVAKDVRSGDVEGVAPRPPKIPRRPVRRIIDQQATLVD